MVRNSPGYYQYINALYLHPNNRNSFRKPGRRLYFGNVFCGTLPITGTPTVCAGTTTTLSDATTGGTWASGTTTIATVGSTGIVTGVAGGTVTISYTNAGCTVTAIVTVNPLPNAGAITSAGIDTVVCVGRTITLTETASGGVWTSTNVLLATVGSTGIVIGV